MFYQGDLQSGINEAVREVKQVVCFITGPYSSQLPASELDLRFHWPLADATD